MSILMDLIAGARADFQARQRNVTQDDLRVTAAALPPAASLRSALSAGDGLHFMAEIKRASPSAGDLAVGLSAGDTAGAYAEAGASAVSVLTEGRRFGGSLDDLREVSAQVEIPILRKDFVIDAYQIWEARAYGASAVLLIAAGLQATAIVQLMADCRDAGVEALVEVHSADELAIAAGCGAKLIGVNARDLNTFEVDLSVCERLAAQAPPDVTLVAESGIRTRADVERLEAAGYRAFLVGEALVTADDPAAALRALAGD